MLGKYLIIMLLAAAAELSPIEELQQCTTAEELRKAFRKLALELHPDRASGDPQAAADLFATVRTAYENILSSIEAKENGAAAGVSAASWNDQWSRMCSRAGRRLEAVGTGGARSHSAAGFAFHVSHNMQGSAGPGMFAEPLPITLAHVMRGVRLPFTASRATPCTQCQGQGFQPQPQENGHTAPCSVCSGHGYRLRTRHVHAHGLDDAEDVHLHDADGGDAVQHTCEGCCGTGARVHACPLCNGTGTLLDPVHGSIDIPAGLRDGEVISLKDVFTPTERDDDAPEGEEEANEQRRRRKEKGECEGGDANAGVGPGGCDNLPGLWVPSHLKVEYNLTRESTRGFVVQHPHVVKVASTSLTRFCTARLVKLTLPTGDMHILSLGPSEYLTELAERRAAKPVRRRPKRRGKRRAWASASTENTKQGDSSSAALVEVNGTSSESARSNESHRAGRQLAGVQSLRLHGMGMLYARPDGVKSLGDAALLLRVAFPDRLGEADTELFSGCFGGTALGMGLIRGTALLLASVRARMARHDCGANAKWAAGLHISTPVDDPMTTVVDRWAWYGP